MTKREWQLVLEYEIWPDQIIYSIGRLTLFEEKFTKKLKLKIL